MPDYVFPPPTGLSGGGGSDVCCNIQYAASGAFTIDLHSLGSVSLNTGFGGQESTAIDNTTNRYMDYLIGGKIKTGTSPTAGLIEVWAHGMINDTPTYADTLTGSDAAISFTSRDVLRSSMRLLKSMVTDTTSNRTYWFAPTSLASLFYGVCPAKFGLVVVNMTGVALHATGSNHVINYTPVYLAA